MTAEAISRVTSALQARLQAALVAAADPGSVFVGPFDDPQAQAASLSVFPYRIVPNASLRNTEHRVPSPTSPPPYIVYRDASGGVLEAVPQFGSWSVVVPDSEPVGRDWCL